jgi:hypothetical protein
MLLMINDDQWIWFALWVLFLSVLIGAAIWFW